MPRCRVHIDPGGFESSERGCGEFEDNRDQSYNPNLTLERTDCGPRLPEEL